jgi:hypothetical protein
MVTEKTDNKLVYKYKLTEGISEVKGGVTVLKEMNYPEYLFTL